MNGLPYYKAYPRDFIEGTIGMSFELKAAYRLVLDLIYMQAGNLPDDARYISGLLGCTVRKWNTLRDELVSMGKIEINGEFLTNKRAVIELETSRKFTEKQSGNRSKPNKNKTLKSPRLNHTDTDTDTEISSLHSDIPISVHSHRSKPENEDRSEEFWKAYPRREGPNPKKPAIDRFRRLVRKGVDPEAIISAARRLAAEHPEPSRFIPQAITFLNQERWNDGGLLIAGDEFCPDDWPNTRFLVSRFRSEKGTDPPRAVNGGKSGFLIPAEWVEASKQRMASNA